MEFYFNPFFQFVYVIIVGAMVGSFVNVLISRIPKNESIVSPPSHCPKCNTPIKWYDNIPILSYIILGGKCRSCKIDISLKYPLVEFLTAALFALLLYKYIAFAGVFKGPEFLAPFLVQISAITLLIAIGFIDLEHRLIPHIPCLVGTFVIIGLSAWFYEIQGYYIKADMGVALVRHTELLAESPHINALLSSAMGAAVATAVFWALRFVGSVIFKKEALGEGDIYLMAMIGALLGWKGVVIIFFLAPIPGSIIGIIMWKLTKNKEIPYGPFLILATFALIYFPAFFYGWLDNAIKILS